MSVPITFKCALSNIYVRPIYIQTCMAPMEDGGVDRTVIDCRQNQLGQMADFPPLLTFLTFDL